MRQYKSNRSKDLEAIITIIIVLMAVWYLTGKQHNFLLLINTSFCFLSLLSERLTSLFVKTWMKLAEWIGFVMNKVLLTLIYFLFLTPIAVISRLFQSENQFKFKNRSGKSYYTDRNHQFTPKDLENIW